jgi:hypothetical protein
MDTVTLTIPFNSYIQLSIMLENEIAEFDAKAFNAVEDGQEGLSEIYARLLYRRVRIMNELIAARKVAN